MWDALHPTWGVTGFDREIGLCMRVARVSDSLIPAQNSKCEQSSTGNPFTYPDEGLAARLRSRSLSAVHQLHA